MQHTPWHRRMGVVVLAGCVIALLTFGVRSTFGLFIDPLSALRGWDRESIALAIALQNLLWGIGQPFAGAIADRYGEGRVLAGGAALYAAGTALMAASTGEAALALTGGVMVGLGVAGGSFTIVLAAFTRLVPADRRSWAMGVATAAGSLGQFLLAPLGQAFISAYGPLTALVLLAGLLALVPVLALALRRQAVPGGSGAPPLPAMTAIRGAASHPSYGLLGAGFFVCGFHVAFITTHLPPYLTDNGLPASLAAWSLGLIGLCNIIGSYVSGVLGDRHSKRLLLVGIYALRGIVFALFVAVPLSTASVLMFSAAIGILWLSTVPPTSGLVAVMFGTGNVGSLFGVVFLSHQVGAFVGVWLGGVVYAATGAYDAVWAAAIVLGFTAAAVHLPIRERAAPTWAASPA